MKPIGIIGFGSLGRQLLGFLTAVQKPRRVVRFDDVLYGERAEDSFPFDGFLDPKFADLEFYVALGYRHLPRKAEILRQLLAAGRHAPSFVHPTCHVGPASHIGAGCLLYPMCNVDQEVEVGDGVLLNNSVVVSHNSRLGAAAYLSPGVVLSGNVTVGRETFLGSGTLVTNNCRIGARVRSGIGTVITFDVPDDASVIGNPQRLLERPLELS